MVFVCRFALHRSSRAGPAPMQCCNDNRDAQLMNERQGPKYHKTAAGRQVETHRFRDLPSNPTGTPGPCAASCCCLPELPGGPGRLLKLDPLGEYPMADPASSWLFRSACCLRSAALAALCLRCQKKAAKAAASRTTACAQHADSSTTQQHQH